MYKIVLEDLDADIKFLEITPCTMELCARACKKKKIHVSCALVHVCIKFLIEYTDGVMHWLSG